MATPWLSPGNGGVDLMTKVLVDLMTEILGDLSTGTGAPPGIRPPKAL